MSRRIGILFAIGLILIITTQGALAKQYTHDENHYSLTVPDTWTESSSIGVDVMFTGSGGTNMNVVTVKDTTIRNDESYLLEQTQQGLNLILEMFDDVVTVQQPRTFTTTSDRLAADYIIDVTSGGITLRMRQVMFVSEYWKMGYVITFTAEKSEFSSYNSIWNEAVDSFTVHDEGPITDSFPMYIAIGAIVGGVIGGVVAAIVYYKRKKKQVQQPAYLTLKEGEIPQETSMESQPMEPKR